jgi:excisionase family DNA binding protein
MKTSYTLCEPHDALVSLSVTEVMPPRERTPTVMKQDNRTEDRLLTPSEVAALFRVDPKTVTRWAQQGKLRSIRTLGGHRRYSESEIQAFLEDSQGVPRPRSAED